MISKKHSMIIQSLAAKNEYVTAEELSRQIEVSVRTVKRYIQDLNYFLQQSGVEISSAKGIGYKLKGPVRELRRIREAAEKCLAGFQIDDSSEGRITKILCAFLNRDYVTAEELSDILNLSIPSTNKLLVPVKRILRQYDLRIVSKPFHGSQIVGEELKIRELILHYAIQSDENNFLEIRLDSLSRPEVQEMEAILTAALKEDNIILADKDFNLLLTRILVAVARVRQNRSIGRRPFKESYRLHNYTFIRAVMKKIAAKLALPLDEKEALYVSASSGVIIYDYNTRRKLTADARDKVSRLVEEALAEIRLVTGIDFSGDATFINALVMHLKIFMNRFKAGISARNPLLTQIKTRFPLETNLAAMVAKKLNEKFQVLLDEDEIGFITMHFGAAFERRRGTGGKKVCIICHYGIGTSQLLAEKLKQRISNLTIVGTYPVRYLDIALQADMDFIVSTVKLDRNDFKVPVLYIENVFSDDFVEKFHQAFQEREEKSKIFRETFKPEAFFRLSAATPVQAIESLGRAMQAKGLIDEHVIAMVLERETMSSTDIGNLVAIPHTILEGAYQSVIGVGVLDKPILWKKEEVQLIFLVCFNRQDSYYFPMFKYLYHFIKDPGEVVRVIKNFSFDKLMELFDVK
ncbi:phosphotransferase system eiib component type 2/3 [Lucifera butyrica]|uniref:Phosphotransferase system eiib component type 2/3 n=1 Tax=Lucifera butyrica TaxID=1351585 RepID=A0A498RHN6_9FIRM|nr:BglG family transcription antiterminator [Lucifera butyrica]VBB09602.1 phosphotransferase system eiib component type 2/3 [Lucifera butyrica]